MRISYILTLYDAYDAHYTQGESSRQIRKYESKQLFHTS